MQMLRIIQCSLSFLLPLASWVHQSSGRKRRQSQLSKRKWFISYKGEEWIGRQSNSTNRTSYVKWQQRQQHGLIVVLAPSSQTEVGHVDRKVLRYEATNFPNGNHMGAAEKTTSWCFCSCPSMHPGERFNLLWDRALGTSTGFSNALQVKTANNLVSASTFHSIELSAPLQDALTPCEITDQCDLNPGCLHMWGLRPTAILLRWAALTWMIQKG
jgi:hypothetical protein